MNEVSVGFSACAEAEVQTGCIMSHPCKEIHLDFHSSESDFGQGYFRLCFEMILRDYQCLWIAACRCFWFEHTTFQASAHQTVHYSTNKYEIFLFFSAHPPVHALDCLWREITSDPCTVQLLPLHQIMVICRAGLHGLLCWNKLYNFATTQDQG